MITGVSRNTSYVDGGVYNQETIGKSLVLDRDIDINIITNFFINKGITDDNLESIIIEEAIYALVDGNLQIVFKNGEAIFINLIGNINKSVKGIQSKEKQVDSDVSIGKMIE